ncbi:hypothetical protein ACEYYB_01080 [Paracoccus sp. p4-l81]|uniref:hypothetical protein n=1 Tax=Paracoccus sp. p4-l81 TaxID=3342806 RepID=UPI0035BAF2C8
MFRALLPVFALTFASAAMAGGCATTDGTDNCVRVLGCIGDQGRWFDGTAIGRGHGTLTATTSDGITCTGSFDQQTGLYGTAEADCADGTRMTVMFLYQDSYTGTALGHGQTDTG